jgi:hypothetical protein
MVSPSQRPRFSYGCVVCARTAFLYKLKKELDAVCIGDAVSLIKNYNFEWIALPVADPLNVSAKSVWEVRAKDLETRYQYKFTGGGVFSLPTA